MQLKKLIKKIALVALIALAPLQFGHTDSGQIIGPGGSGGGGGGSTYTNTTPTPVTLGGILAGTTFTAQTMQQMFDMLLYPYIAPTVTLGSTPGSGVYEFGNPQAPITLSATTVRNTNPITSVIFQRSNNGGAYSTINTVASPIGAGGVENYIDVTGVGGFASTAYRSTVGDGTSTSNSNVRNYTYVYPFYHGVGSPGLSGAAIAGLTKSVVIQSNYTRAFSPSSQVYYYAYPSAYPALTSIIDQNGFNITADWTVVSPIVITGLDGTPQDYRVYEFNNLTSLGQNITFNF